MNPDDLAREEAPRGAVGVVASVTLGAAVLLLAAAPWAARQQPADKGWYLAPVNWSALSLLIMGGMALILAYPVLGGLRGSRGRGSFRRHAGWAFDGLGPASIYGLLFCLYLLLLNFLGFTLSTWAFAQLCIWRSGLRTWKWALWTAIFVAALVLILRVGMGLWFPQAGIFKFLPDALGNALGRYL